MSLVGKVAIITGGSKGIGKATALRFAKDGAKVVIGYHSDRQGAEAVVKEIGSDKALAVQGHAGEIKDTERLVKQTVDKFGKIDIVVPNGGILPSKSVENTSEADFDDIFAINVKGPWFLIQKALPHMAAGSHIVLISTTLCHASTLVPPYSLYVATKGAVEQMVRGLSKDLSRRGICVNAVAPGPTATDLFMEHMNPAILKGVESAIPRGRIGKPEEIADAIALVSGEQSSWITGQVLKANGGMA